MKIQGEASYAKLIRIAALVTAYLTGDVQGQLVTTVPDIYTGAGETQFVSVGPSNINSTFDIFGGTYEAGYYYTGVNGDIHIGGVYQPPVYDTPYAQSDSDLEFSSSPLDPGTLFNASSTADVSTIDLNLGGSYYYGFVDDGHVGYLEFSEANTFGNYVGNTLLVSAFDETPNQGVYIGGRADIPEPSTQGLLVGAIGFVLFRTVFKFSRRRRGSTSSLACVFSIALSIAAPRGRLSLTPCESRKSTTLENGLRIGLPSF